MAAKKSRLLKDSDNTKKTTIVSAADAAYFVALKSLVLSLEENSHQLFDIGVLDLGLEPEQLSWLQRHAVTVVTPGWDIEFPNRKEEVGEQFKAMVSRPFVYKYFKGYDFYIWMDADTWLQDGSALDLLLEGARRSGVAVVPEIDRSYKAFYDGGFARKWMAYMYLQGWGEEIAKELVHFPIINSGVWCFEAGHPIWESWQESLAKALQNSRNFFIEQTALNLSIHTRSGWNPHFLPATSNWNCAHATPVYDPEQRQFVEPFLPHGKIGVLHLCGINPKTKKIPIKRTDGRTEKVCLLFAEQE